MGVRPGLGYGTQAPHRAHMLSLIGPESRGTEEGKQQGDWAGESGGASSCHSEALGAAAVLALGQGTKEEGQTP